MWPLICCVFLLATCALLNKHAVSGTNPFSIQLINTCVNVCLAPIWFLLAKKTQTGDLINKSTLVYVVIAGILSTIGFLLFLTGLKNKPASVATSILSTYPIVAALIGAALGLEKFSPMKFGGILMIVIGITITVYYSE